jgi:hypothetical protein
MAITGIHTLLHTPDADALRATLRDAFGWDSIDAGQGWLIFRLPPSELGVHPGEQPGHQISVMCDDLTSTVEDLRAKGITFKGEVVDAGFGSVQIMVLPGGVEMQLYEPRHPTAIGT